MHRVVITAIVALASFAPSLASAQQPLAEFLAAAESGSLDTQEARAALRQAQAQVDEARARLLPGFTAQGAYQRNEFEAAFMVPGTTDRIVIQPFDALTAQFSLFVPLIDIGAWSVFFQSEALAEASEAQLEATSQNVDVVIVQLWHQLVGSRALISAAERNVAALTRDRDASAARVEVGVAPQLELSRAEAERSRALQALAEARLQAILAARNLENVTGLTPDDRVADLEYDLPRERSLEEYMARADEQPAVRAAREAARAAEIASQTAWTALLPTIAGFARESGSNAAGFQGANWAYAVGVSATWQLDFLRPAQIGTRAAAAEVAAVRAARAALQTETDVYEAWQRVGASAARAEAAAVGIEAARRAVEDARASFDAGVATQLDLIQAERDLFQAEVLRIQAVADLRVARMVLRIRTGMEL